MAKKRRTKRRTTRRKAEQDYPGWVWMLFGLSIGLAVAFAVFMSDRKPRQPVVAVAQPEDPASLAAPLPKNAADDNGEAAVAAEPPEQRFDFNNMLPNFEVVIPEEEPQVQNDIEHNAIEEPGVYVLQAGSFSSYEDADRRRAQLALQGIESQIQRVAIDDKTYHRVRIGPIADLNELNMTRARLRQAKIDVLRIRLGDAAAGGDRRSRARATDCADRDDAGPTTDSRPTDTSSRSHTIEHRRRGRHDAGHRLPEEPSAGR
jgi:hypothetical protein